MAEGHLRCSAARAALTFAAVLSSPDARAAAAEPDVAIAPPDAWIVDGAFDGPDLSKTPQLTPTRWTAWRRGDAVLVVGCFRAPLDTWSPEMAPLAIDRVAALVTSTALRLDAGASLARGALREDGAILSMPLAGDAMHARAWLAFTGGPSDRRDEPATKGSAAHGCMALCAHGACDDLVEHATLTGRLTAPPPASPALRALLALIHHPRATALGGLALALLAGVIAITTRRRPRARPLAGPHARDLPARIHGASRADEANRQDRASDRC